MFLSDYGNFKHITSNLVSNDAQAVYFLTRTLGPNEGYTLALEHKQLFRAFELIESGLEVYICFFWTDRFGINHFGAFQLSSLIEPCLGTETDNNYFWSRKSGDLVIRVQSYRPWSCIARHALGDDVFNAFSNLLAA